MYKIGICGHFGKGKKLLNGQTIKTKILEEELKVILGDNQIAVVDTCDWKKNIFNLLKNTIKMIKSCENIIILPAQNGIKVFVPLFSLLNLYYNKKIHYIVIGGWLPTLIKNNKWIIHFLKKLDGIYVETNSMKISLSKLGIKNCSYLPNLKRLSILKDDELIYEHKEPYKLCTFSRVTETKGISIAIDAVENANRELGRSVYCLDIYGPIEEEYKDKFYEILNKSTAAINYRGVVDYDKSVEVLKSYFMLLFPTYYEGEGFAGTLLDAFSAGLPTICNDWKYNSEIIKDKQDGFVYQYNNKEKLKELLIMIYNEPSIVINMKKKCLKRAEEYMPDKVINNFLKKSKII